MHFKTQPQLKQQYETEMDSRTVCGNVQKSGKMQQKHILFHQDSGFRHIALLCISFYTIPLASWLVVTSSTLNVLFFPKSRSAPGLNLTLHTVLKQMLTYPPRAAGSQSQQNADLPIGCWSLCIALKHYCSSSVNQNHTRPGVQLPPTFPTVENEAEAQSQEPGGQPLLWQTWSLHYDHTLGLKTLQQRHNCPERGMSEQTSWSCLRH